MSKVEHAAKDATVFEDVLRSTAKNVSRLNRLIKPIAVFTRGQMYHHVQFKLAEKWLLQSRECLWTGEGEKVPNPHGTHCERKDKAGSTVASSDTAEIHRDLSARQS